jgi:hypothetical protein
MNQIINTDELLARLESETYYHQTKDGVLRHCTPHEKLLPLINELSKNDPIVKVRELREDVRQKVIAWNDGDGADKMVQRALNRVLTRIDELFPDDLEDKRHEEV